MQVKPYRIDVADEALQRLHARLDGAHWPVLPSDPDPGSGLSPVILRQFIDHLTGPFDWRGAEARLNRLPQFTAQIDGQPIHFLHYLGSGSAPRPLLLIHGWPGGVLEFSAVAERLAHPERFGGDAEDAFSVVIPTLPGFGMVAPPDRPMGPRRIAALFDRLMLDLGYHAYLAQGGDWGASVASWLGLEAKGCAAVHLNFTTGWTPQGDRPQGRDEEAAAAQWARFIAQDGGYLHIMGTRPMTLGYALADSPLGALAWTLEKFVDWSDLDGGSLWSVFDRDILTSHILLQLIQGAAATSAWIYRAVRDEPVPAGARVERPTAVARYPKELGQHPISRLERRYNIVRCTQMARGGHFAAMEQPVLFSQDLLAFGRQLRAQG